ncbi:MAG: ABC transporter permease [Treponema sp.]|jgi:ribose/xylose/arabinose/galactoside ABC-type transport system permease subunit|nr:ABC transporter permease [Treponema sp.]
MNLKNIKTMANNSGQGSVFLIFAFIAIAVFFSAMNHSFLSFANFSDILMRVAVIAPIAIGIMFCLTVRGIDLSSGTVVGITGIVLANSIKMGNSLPAGILVMLLLGLIIGLIDAVLIAKLNMNPFVATLAIMFVGSSFEKVITKGGLPVYLYNDKSGIMDIYRGHIAGIPFPIVILFFLVLITYLIHEKTVIGRRLRASGESIKGAANAGINVRFYYGLAYVLSAVLSAVSGLIIASQVQSGQPLVGQSYLWDAIGAAYLSTTMSRARRPNVPGTVFGTLFLSMINNGLTIMGLPFYWKTFFNGLIILFVLLTSAVNRALAGKADKL